MRPATLSRALVALAIALVGLSCRLPIQRGRWNVLVVVVDSLRADHLGAYGYPRPTSPTLDALAAEGYLFRDARAQSSCSGASVASLLTSRYPARFYGRAGGAAGIPAGTRSLAETLGARGWSSGAVSASPVVSGQAGASGADGFARGFGHFDAACVGQDASCIGGHALKGLTQLREPFLFYLHYADPHAPYQPPKAFRQRFRIGQTGQHWAMRGNPHPLTLTLEGGHRQVVAGPAELDFLRGLYDGEIAFVDHQLGELLAALRQRRLLERTIVVVVSGQGESFFEHGSLEHCRTLFDGEIRTPMLVRLPQRRPGVRVDGAVQNLDLVPTLVDLLGLPVAGQGFEGRSLLAQLDGRRPQDGRAFATVGSQRAVADDRYKLIADLGSGSWQLFDVRADPGEQHDLRTAEPEVFARLQRELRAWLARTEGPDGLRQSTAVAIQQRALDAM